MKEPNIAGSRKYAVGSKNNTEKNGFSISAYCLLFTAYCLLLTAYCLLPAFVSAADKWTGVDESVVEKYAKEHGREASKPLIDIEQGDLPLFLFLIAGTIGGFTAGYYWRKLTEPGEAGQTHKQKNGAEKE